MSDLDPNEATTTTDLDATTSTPTPTGPLTPTSQTPTNPTPQPYEPAVAWAPAVPVVPASAPRRGGRLRWAAAIAVVALVVAATTVVAALITGQSANATVLGYVPPGTIVYGEVRLDLPGDQRRAVGEFLSKFPGFADQAALDTKLDEVLDEFVKSVSNGDQTYTTDIKPWFDGEVAFSLGPLPPASSLTADPSSMKGLRALLLLSIKDPTAAQAWFDAAITKSGAKTTTETYGGATLTVAAEGAGPSAAFALLDGKVAVVGDVVSVKAAVDTKGASGFAGEPGPKAALGSANGDHVGFMYVALRPLLDWSTELSKLVPSNAGGAAGAAGAALSSSMLKAIPDWTAFWLRVASDAVVMEATAPKPETSTGPTDDRTSAITEHIPSSAIVVSISHDLGATLKQTLALYASEPGVKEMLDQLDQGSVSSAAGTRRSAGSATQPWSSTRRPARPRAGWSSPPRTRPRRNGCSPRCAPSSRSEAARRASPSARNPTRARPSRSSISGTSARSPGCPAPRAGFLCRRATSRSPTRRPTISSSSPRAGVRQARARHDEGDLDRLRRAVQGSRRSGREGDRECIRRHRGRPRARREVDRQRRRVRVGQVRDRRQAVPDPIRRDDGVEFDQRRPDEVHRHHHRQVTRRISASIAEEGHHHSWQSASG